MRENERQKERGRMHLSSSAYWQKLYVRLRIRENVRECTQTENERE